MSELETEKSANGLFRNSVNVSSVAIVSVDKEELLLLDVSDLQAEQTKYLNLAALFLYLQDGTLPEDEKLVKQIEAKSK